MIAEEQIASLQQRVGALEAQCDALRLALFATADELHHGGDPAMPVVACVSASGNLRHHVGSRPAPQDPRRLLVTLADARAAVSAAAPKP